MSHILSLAAGTLPEFLPDQVAQAAGQSGFSHVGFTIEPDKWSAEQAKATKAAIKQHDLFVLDVEVIWIPEGGVLTDDHRLIIDVGAELGAPNVLVVSAEPDPDRTAAALHQLCEWAAPANMRVSLEFLMITAVQSLDTALDIVHRCDHPAAAVLIDSLHFQRAGHAAADLKTVTGNLLHYSQICDGNLHCADDFDAYLEDAIDLRSAPGEGELPLIDILDALPMDIPLSLEVRSKTYRDQYPDPVERAKAVRVKSLAYLDKTGISIR
ncbi:sugar phosphate isomerase/epimerase family protein [Parasphingorhabdus cellanae]|uniref:Sugar phosphate isomerase/epimerase n=1 Tax=Parasphingorhabdus cellanae TaxID=2806553 RepID=A0ABX7TA94_9SPHN|nr:TIM barrel protein [Parasphingorhabdus cellanae]QTD57602.1 sugar phosphate isomerase/epimerase [Parasphingorhabdus cellanae]